MPCPRILQHLQETPQVGHTRAQDDDPAIPGQKLPDILHNAFIALLVSYHGGE